MKSISRYFPFLVLVFFVAVVVSAIPKGKTPEPIAAPKKEIVEEVKKEPDLNEGKVVFKKLKQRVCEELDLCWVANGYAISGDKILKKEFITDLGGSSILLPIEEWSGLSDKDRGNLGGYLRSIGVSKIIVGRVVPSKFSDGTINPDRNTMTVDETVWSSDK